MKQINIMTSCDDNLALYIMPQLASIRVNMPEYDIQFYLFHYRISAENIDVLRNYATRLGIAFHEVIVKNAAKFEQLAIRGGIARFPAEAYFWLNCHDELPKNIDRILYIDAGDVIINGDISEYYFDGFGGMSFIATPLYVGIKESGGTLRQLNRGDLEDPICFNAIRSMHVNSGVIVINLEKFRARSDDLFDYYARLSENLEALPWHDITRGTESLKYMGDQGLLGLAFFEDIKFFAYDEVIKNVMYAFPQSKTANAAIIYNTYAPYNYNQELLILSGGYLYVPIVAHYAGRIQSHGKSDIRKVNLKRQE